MSDPIKAALDAAAIAGMNASERSFAERHNLPMDGPGHRAEAARTIAAFLRALPLTRAPTIEECQKARTTTVRPRICYAPDDLAAAVEKAARDD
jgi:hypothetical protein